MQKIVKKKALLLEPTNLMVIILSILAGFIASALASLLLFNSSAHKHAKNPKVNNALNGIVIGFVFLCIAIFVFSVLSH